MKKILTLLLLVMATLSSCMKQDLDEIRSRLSTLEEWQKSVNSDIATLKSLVTALEAKDFVTGVTALSDGTGYVINFDKSGSVTIKHGAKGTDGTTGKTSVVSAKQDQNGKYYWTIDGEWMLVNGVKVPVTGEKGAGGTNGTDAVAPQVKINSETGFWEISTDGGAQWNSTGVKALGEKGEQGDAIFAEDGIDYTSDPENVIFTLADGTTIITLPKASAISVGFESYNTFACSETDNQVTIVLPATLKESDYNAITAIIYNANGTNMDIQTRSNAYGWRVQIIKPSFVAGSLVAGSAKVLITMPQDRLDYKAILKVTLVDSKGREHSASRVVWRQETDVIDNTTGELSGKITDPNNIKRLSIIGSVSDDDFKFIRENLTFMEILDLSRTTITSLPAKAMAFYDKKNTVLKTVILPDGLNTIGNSAFAMCENLTAINMPKSVRTLGKWMFEGCASLEEVKIPECVSELPESAFYEAGVKRITIPETIEKVGAWAFSNCKRLENVIIPSSVTEISEGMFYMCAELNKVVWHDNITSIGDDAFTVCEKLFPNKKVVMPSKVKYIGRRAFSWTGMTSVEFSEGIETIMNSAFSQCPISTIDLPSTIINLHAVAFHWESATTVICRSTTPPTMPKIDDSDNSFPEFYKINQACVLRKPASSDYSTWNGYFTGGVQDL